MAADNASQEASGKFWQRNTGDSSQSRAEQPGPRVPPHPRAVRELPAQAVRGGDSSRFQPRARPDASSRRNALTARVPMHGWRWPVGTAQRVPVSVSQDRGGSHSTRPYGLGLAPSRRGGVALRGGLHQCDSVARIGGRTCVPRSVRRWVAGSGEALSPARSRSGVAPGVGPWLVRSGYRAATGLVRSGSPAAPELVAAGPGGGCAQWAGAPPTGCELGMRSAPRAAISDTCRPRRLLTEPLTPPLSPWTIEKVAEEAAPAARHPPAPRAGLSGHPEPSGASSPGA